MTAIAVTGHPIVRSSRIRRMLAGPRQGWSSLVLLVMMLAATGAAIDEPAWMGFGPDGASQTGLLPLLMVVAGLTGAVLSWSRLSPGWVDLISAVIGTAAGLLFASGAVSEAVALADRMRDLNESLTRFLHDVLVSGIRTQETSAFLMTLSALAWTSGVFAAISVFRRSHAAGAIVPLGAMLVVEILVAHQPQELWLVLFAGASLLLLLRLDLEEQRQRWLRRRISGGQAVGGLFLGGGAVLVALMLLGSIALAGWANSASVTAAFPQLDTFVSDLATSIQGLVGTVPQGSRGTNGEFPERRPVGNSWSTGHTAVFVAEPLDQGPHYWRAAAYDTLDGRTWRRTGSTTQDIPTGEDLLDASEDAVSDGSPYHQLVVADITSRDLAGLQLPAPQNPVMLDRDARLTLMDDEGTFQVFGLQGRLPVGDRYRVTAMEPAIGLPDGLTINRLIAGGTDYPDWIEPFLAIQPGSTGPRTLAEAKAIRESLPRRLRDPYRLAAATQDLLRSDPRFSYTPDIRHTCESGEAVSECLLRTGTGFCQQYATTMVMLLRTLKVPARYIEGYLPGTPSSDGREYEVDASAAHAWVEVWFNDIGWIRFDPTPGDPALTRNGQQPTELPLGPPIATPGPEDSFSPDQTGDDSFDPDSSDSPSPSVEPEASPDPNGTASGGDGAVPPAVVMFLAAVIGALALGLGGGLAWFRRFPGREPEVAWRGIVSLATRLGVGPRPSETPYEYTVTLSKVVPGVARDLRVVADAKVDATYSPPTSPRASMATLRAAYRRVRMSMLRLFFRRGR